MSHRAYRLAMPPNLTGINCATGAGCRVSLPEGHDPNSFFVQGGDARQFRFLLEAVAVKKGYCWDPPGPGERDGSWQCGGACSTESPAAIRSQGGRSPRSKTDSQTPGSSADSPPYPESTGVGRLSQGDTHLSPITTRQDRMGTVRKSLDWSPFLISSAPDGNTQLMLHLRGVRNPDFGNPTG